MRDEPDAREVERRRLARIARSAPGAAAEIEKARAEVKAADQAAKDAEKAAKERKKNAQRGLVAAIGGAREAVRADEQLRALYTPRELRAAAEKAGAAQRRSEQELRVAQDELAGLTRGVAALRKRIRAGDVQSDQLQVQEAAITRAELRVAQAEEALARAKAAAVEAKAALDEAHERAREP